MMRFIPLILILGFFLSACNPSAPSDGAPPDDSGNVAVSDDGLGLEEASATGAEESSTPDDASDVPSSAALSERVTTPGNADETVWRIHPRWQWNGPLITYYERIGDSSSIVIMDANGREISRLHTDSGYAASPNWGPLGNEIIFSNSESGMSGEWDMWRMNSDGSNSRVFIDVEGRIMHPSWDPTNGFIAFVHFQEDGPQLVVGNPRTSGIRQITFTEGERFHPKWLNDNMILLYDKTTGDKTEICQNNVVRRKETCMFSVDGSRVATPAASRNGAIIAFTATPEAEGSTSDLWLYQVANGAFFQLTDTPDESESSPDWSPDGRWVTFHSDRDGEYNIFRMKIDKSGRMQLTNRGQ